MEISRDKTKVVCYLRIIFILYLVAWICSLALINETHPTIGIKRKRERAKVAGEWACVMRWKCDKCNGLIRVDFPRPYLSFFFPSFSIKWLIVWVSAWASIWAPFNPSHLKHKSDYRSFLLPLLSQLFNLIFIKFM